MDFAYSEEQLMLRDSVDRFGEDRWAGADRLARLAEGPEGSRRRWAAMAELGWLMLPIAEAEGGLGGGPVDVMAVMEGFGRHLMTEPYVSNCVLAAGLMHGGGELASDLLARIGAGEVRVAAGLTENDGYAIEQVSVAAIDGPGGVHLSGMKTHVEDGADADWYVVSARTAGAMAERDGISLFLVPRDAAGLTVRRFRAVDGHRHCTLMLDRVPATPLGERDRAADRIDAAVDRAIVAHLAEAVGSMESATAATLDYVRTRQQFGVPIGTFQVIQHKLVDMSVACEEARALAIVATRGMTQPGAGRALIAAAKARISQCGIAVAQQAVQLHGGVGTSEELVVSHHLRRQMMLDLAHGDRDFQRARFILLSAG
ncbi:acyl-CoA dehydrogenase family protein [Sphingomonas colocasiae]|uniref:Acyl-CoA dehydrogenase n=1 Tax=Sphingomonas colocasiae TaxID=1848973 RepID=A0ABS7PQC3_9SPHN|nr:acyl-CoA dehydrogenase [Sphingomonas colocasiae]MBY8822632.1 acyl-CoA dehydrogenase [Sphingomonas colocasiae]